MGRACALYRGGRLRGFTEPQPIRQCSWRRMPMMVGRPGLHQPGSCCSGMDRDSCPCESTMIFQPAKLGRSHTLNVGWDGLVVALRDEGTSNCVLSSPSHTIASSLPVRATKDLI